MSDGRTEDLLLESFATLADTLVAEYDVLDLLQTLVDSCRNLPGVDAAGILLADQNNELDLVVTTSEESRLVETMQLSAYAGPCIEAFTTGQSVVVPDIALAPDRWAQFSARAIEQGFHAVLALPMRLRNQVIGTLNLLGADSGLLRPLDVRAAQALADVATIGILHQRAFQENDLVRQQLEYALQSRIIIEQAKGVVSHTRSVTPEEAFAVIRGHARSNHLKLSELAAQIVNREVRL